MQVQPKVDVGKRVHGSLVLVIFVGSMLSVAAVMMLTAWWASNQPSGTRTAEAPVQVIEIKTIKGYDQMLGEPGTGYDIKYRYTVGGKTYEESLTSSRQRVTQREYKVCYQPGKPENHSLVRVGVECGKAGVLR